MAAELDEDGVASLQLDPGAPVNIVIPPKPWRPAPRRALVMRDEARELIGGQGAPLPDQVELDKWLAVLSPCAKWADESGETTRIGLRVGAGGGVIAAGAGSSALDRCAVNVLRQQRRGAPPVNSRRHLHRHPRIARQNKPSSSPPRPDPAVLRELAIVAAQRAIRDGRTLDVARAALLAEPALAHPNNPVLARLGERAAAYLARNQRPDGTFAGETGWTLQRLLVVTAEATRAATADQATPAARQRAMAVQARAAGAFARTAEQVTDGFTAAAILASGAVTGELGDTLRKRVKAAIQASDDGARYLDAGDGVVRGDGAIPGRIEATALAVLALQGDAQAPPLRPCPRSRKDLHAHLPGHPDARRHAPQRPIPDRSRDPPVPRPADRVDDQLGTLPTNETPFAGPSA